MAFNNIVTTNFGRAAFLSTFTNGNVELTAIAIGSSKSEPEDFRTVTALGNQEMLITTIEKSTVGTTHNVKFDFDNTKVSTDFAWTEIGYFGKVTKKDGSYEEGLIFYGYDNTSNAEIIPAYAGNKTLRKYLYQLGIDLADSNGITVKVESIENYAKKEDFENHLLATNPHMIDCDTIGASAKNHTHAVASETAAGFMSVVDKTFLENLKTNSQFCNVSPTVGGVDKVSLSANENEKWKMSRIIFLQVINGETNYNYLILKNANSEYILTTFSIDSSNSNVVISFSKATNKYGDIRVTEVRQNGTIYKAIKIEKLIQLI